MLVINEFVGIDCAMEYNHKHETGIQLFNHLRVVRSVDKFSSANLITGAQPQAGTGHRMETVSVSWFLSFF